MKIKKNLIICLIFLMIFCGLCKAQEIRPAILNSEQIRQRLSELDLRIQSWYIEYESLPSNNPLQPPGTYIHRIIAAKKPDQYRALGAKGTDAYSWRGDPLQQLFTINSSTAVNEFPLDRVYWYISLEPEDPLPGTAPEEFLFFVLGWWPFEKHIPPKYGDASFILRDIARTPKYIVKSSQELVNHRWCHILEYLNYDKLWLDCEGGTIRIMARELLDPQSGQTMQRIEYRKHKEIKPDIWVPMEFQNTMYELIDQNGNRNKIIDSVFRMLTVKVNEPLSDTLFKFEPRPGSIEILNDGSFKQTVPGGAEYMDELLDWIKRQKQIPRVPTGGSFASVEVVLEYIMSIICIVVIFFLHRRKRIRQLTL